MRTIGVVVAFLVLAGCGGEVPLSDKKPDGKECSDSEECLSGFCGTAEITPFVGACMADPAK